MASLESSPSQTHVGHPADDKYYFYEPSKGHGLPHDPFKAIVGPRPIGWISTCDANGRSNIAPYSFFNAISDAPPAVFFASDGWKDSARNIRETGEFAFNLVTKRHSELMNRSSIRFEQGINEFDEVSIKSLKCNKISAPRVADSPAVLECRLLNILELVDLDGRKTNYKIVMGQVVGVHIDERYLKEGLFDMANVGSIMRAGYRGEYVQVNPDAFFTMTRPVGSY